MAFPSTSARWLACALLLGSGAAAASDGAIAAGPCAAAEATLPDGALLDLFDPAAPMDRRKAALTAYQRLAGMQQCPRFGYTLGLLYRHGPDLPGNLLPQDVPRARALIAPMAEAGDLNAFADMAEMEMRHANAREAMLWTQLYLHFVKAVALDFAEDAEDVRFQYSAYNSNLLARTELVWSWARPRLPRKLIREDLNAWLDAHGAEAERRMRARMQEADAYVAAPGEGTGVSIARQAGDCHVNLPSGIGAASATWIVEVFPSGKTGRVVLENFVPNTEVTERMRHCLSGYRFNPFAGTEPVSVRIPMVVGSPEARGLQRR